MVALSNKKRKGFVYTLEALIVIGIVFVLMAFVFRFSIPASQPDVVIIKRAGIDALEYMEQNFDLRRYVSEVDTAQIDKGLASILAGNIKFETEICSASCNPVGVPAKQTVVVVDYYIAAYRDGFEGQKIRLWMWR